MCSPTIAAVLPRPLKTKAATYDALRRIWNMTQWELERVYGARKP
jgi:hypothetical protein